MGRNGLILDRYEPLGTAGAGGFGTVRIAWDPRIQRKVAIKTIGLSEADARRAGLPGADAVAGAGAATGGPTADRWHGVQPWDEFLEESWESWEDGAGPEVPPMEAGSDDEPAEPAEPVTSLAHIPGLDEARTAAKLTDSRIVGVYDFEVRGQIAYLIMEYVEGITLTRLLADYEDFLTLDVVAAVFDAVAGALAVAHKAGVLHLDIKPDNILINADGQVKVTDFGLATLADASGTGLAGGGTIGYMPLEQMRREPLDARTDEWSLASVVYEMLTGDNPFRANDLAGAEAAIEGAEIVLPSLHWEDVDEQIDDVVFYALDPDRERRYASVSDFAEELDKFLGDAAAGKRQLAAVVQDALGVFDEDDADAGEGADEDAEGARGAARRPGFVRRVAGRIGGWAGERFSGRWPWLVGRVLVAGLVAYLGVFAASHLYATAPLLGQETASAVAVASAVVLAAMAAAWPPAGILIAGVLVGLAFSVANVVLVGIALAVGTLVWWYVFWRLDGQGQGQGHPVLLRVAALVLVALLAALLVLVPVRVDYLPAAVVVVVAIAVSGALL